MELFGTMRNAPNIRPSHDSILELWQTFPNGRNAWALQFASNTSYKKLIEIAIYFKMTMVLCGGGKMAANK